MHSIDELFRAVVREQDDDARWSAIRELHALGTREVLDRALRLCRSGEVAERIAGAEIAGELEPWAAVTRPALEAMLDDEDALVVEAAVHALRQQQDSQTVSALSRVAAHDSPNVRWAVATALEDLISDEIAERVLLALMDDRDNSVRDRATFAVGSLSERDTPRIRAALLARLADPDPAVANEAALGLARRHDSRAIPYLASAVECAEGEIEEAIDEITAPEMLTDLLKARDAMGESGGLQRLIERCRARL